MKEFVFRETSVWTYSVKLKDCYKSSSYLDLSKIAGIRVDAGKLLKQYRLETNTTRMKLAMRLGVKLATLETWEIERNSVPLDLLLETARIAGVTKETVLTQLEELGAGFTINRSTPVVLPIRSDKLRWSNYIPYNGSIVYSLEERKCRFSKTLNAFLKTFFEYAKKPKLAPPLTSISKELVTRGMDTLLPASILMITEGCENWQKRTVGLSFTNNSKFLHDLLVDFVFLKYGMLPSSYFIKISKGRKNPIFVTEYHGKYLEHIAKDMISLVGSLKTAPHDDQTVSEYYNGRQPALDFILSRSEMERIETLKLFIATEGSVYLTTRFGFAYPAVEIGCAHPKIDEFLERLGAGFGLNFKTEKSKRTWSGVKGVRARGISTAIRLLRMSAFMKNVKITSKSKYFEGYEKEDVLLAILELHRRQESDKSLFGISEREMNAEMARILKNKELKPAKFYIGYFSKKKKVSNWLANG